jgi:hypothetical protein
MGAAQVALLINHFAFNFFDATLAYVILAAPRAQRNRERAVVFRGRRNRCVVRDFFACPDLAVFEACGFVEERYPVCGGINSISAEAGIETVSGMAVGAGVFCA